ncbi:hypothetical protein [Ligaoa zhengdingensis]|uniref:hypothetical protein n=1 Tax=Ligaoa zhengdingensis TaxID=2763658 RepID=UPI0031CCD5BD
MENRILMGRGPGKTGGLPAAGDPLVCCAWLYAAVHPLRGEAGGIFTKKITFQQNTET